MFRIMTKSYGSYFQKGITIVYVVGTVPALLNKKVFEEDQFANISNRNKSTVVIKVGELGFSGKDFSTGFYEGMRVIDSNDLRNLTKKEEKKINKKWKRAVGASIVKWKWQEQQGGIKWKQSIFKELWNDSLIENTWQKFLPSVYFNLVLG